MRRRTYTPEQRKEIRARKRKEYLRTFVTLGVHKLKGAETVDLGNVIVTIHRQTGVKGSALYSDVRKHWDGEPSSLKKVIQQYEHT